MNLRVLIGSSWVLLWIVGCQKSPTSEITTRVLVPYQESEDGRYRALAYLDSDALTAIIVEATPLADTVDRSIPLGTIVITDEDKHSSEVFGISVPIALGDSIFVVLTDGDECVCVREFKRDQFLYSAERVFPDDLAAFYSKVMGKRK